VGEKIHLFKVFVGNPEGKRPRGRVSVDGRKIIKRMLKK
jgi:hypothetical protein